MRKMVPEKESENSSTQVLIHIDENEKSAYIIVRKANKISKNEKLEILKYLKNFIDQFIEDKYNKIYIDLSRYLELSKQEMEYLINYYYNNLNDPMPENKIFIDDVDSHIYAFGYFSYKFINEKCHKIDKNLDLNYDCKFIDYKGNQVCALYDIYGTTNIFNCIT
jgi:hypothetical protein